MTKRGREKGGRKEGRKGEKEGRKERKQEGRQNSLIKNQISCLLSSRQWTVKRVALQYVHGTWSSMVL
jgi:hypothetical protein